MKPQLTDKKWFIYAIVFVCALSWGLSFLGTTVTLKKLNVIQLLAARWTVSAVIFLLLALLGIIKVKFRGKNIKLILLSGLLQPCVYSIFETAGIKLTTASESSIFIATIPLAVLLIGALFLGHRHSRRTIFAIMMAFAGVVICVAFSPEFSLGGKGLGYLCLIGAILSGAFYSYGSSKASAEFNAIEVTFGISILGAVFFNGINFAMGYGFSGYRICFGDGETLAGVLFLGIFCSCLCYLIFNFVLGKLPTAIGSNLVSNSTTAVGVISGCFLGGDPFGWYTVVGLTLTITGICISSLPGAKQGGEVSADK